MASVMIRLEKWVTTKDGSGNNIEILAEKINAFAEVTRLSGDRASLNGVTHLDNFFEFIVRFSPKFNITGNWRLIYGGKRFTVHSIEKMEEKRFYWRIRAQANAIEGNGLDENYLLMEDGSYILEEDKQLISLE